MLQDFEELKLLSLQSLNAEIEQDGDENPESSILSNENEGSEVRLS